MAPATDSGAMTKCPMCPLLSAITCQANCPNCTSSTKAASSAVRRQGDGPRRWDFTLRDRVCEFTVNPPVSEELEKRTVGYLLATLSQKGAWQVRRARDDGGFHRSVDVEA